MFCNKCGRIIEEGAKFCSKCGAPVENQEGDIVNNQPIQNENNNQVNQNNYNETQQNQNYDNIIHPDMKKYAIASIAIPAISIIVYWFIGLPLYIAILLASFGFGLAKKGKEYSKKISIIAYVLNSILVVMCIIMFFAIMIEKFA